MEKIYNGKLDLELIRISPPEVDAAKVDTIVDRYRRPLERLSPGRLEAGGTLPVELLREMGEVRLIRSQCRKGVWRPGPEFA